MPKELMKFGLLFMSWLKMGSWRFWRGESFFYFYRELFTLHL
ncbi:hypothetical protein MNB_SV-12-788 [hydrothermal vent metagenome]|uniref:Uncharacterized protein n=1 Tax=hydrothermal vent metagenome TaxID=652676 RepID=A0A1W1BDJ9_9ZZZZ